MNNDELKLSPHERSMLESLRTAAKAHGVTVEIEADEVVYRQDDREIGREPISSLGSLLGMIKVDKK